MTNPITPPPELVQEWWEEADQYQDDPKTYFDHVATQAAQWGADQELEAILEMGGQQELPEEDRYFDGFTVASIRATRRPKLPSLKKQALAALNVIEDKMLGPTTEEKLIRRALETLND